MRIIKHKNSYRRRRGRRVRSHKQRYHKKRIKTKRRMAISPAQKRKIDEIKKYIEEDVKTSDLQELQSFKIEEHPLKDMPPSEVLNKIRAEEGRRPLKGRFGKSLVSVRAVVDVPPEKRRNPFLKDTYFFILKPEGGIDKAEKSLFLGGKPIDLKWRFKRSKRKKYEG